MEGSVSNRGLTVAVAGAVVFLISAAPVWAQTPAAPARPAAIAAATGEAAADVEGGVDLGNWVRNAGVTTHYETGWFVGASARANRLISIVAQLGGDYHKASTFTQNIYAYSGGVRFGSGLRDKRCRPFAVLMMGGAQDNGDGTGKINHYAVVTPGGGVDLGVTPRFAVRARLDFPLYMTFGQVYKGARVAVGVVVPLGSK
jgi:hypothetical protein